MNSWAEMRQVSRCSQGLEVEPAQHVLMCQGTCIVHHTHTRCHTLEGCFGRGQGAEAVGDAGWRYQ